MMTADSDPRPCVNYENRVKAFKVSPKTRTPSKKKKDTAVNPYQRAFELLFSELPDWKQREFKGFMASGDVDNRHFASFIVEVTSLGDAYSDGEDPRKVKKEPSKKSEAECEESD